MAWKLGLVGVLSFLVADLFAVTDPAPPPPPPQGAAVPVAPPPQLRLPIPKFYPENEPPPGGNEYIHGWWGQVTAVDEFSITLLGKDEVKPKRFPVGGLLAGQPQIGVWGTGGYALSDVRVADLVHIQYYHSARRGILDLCLEVRIYRRPGGKVPPCPDEVPRLPFRWHEKMQAYQDWEEQGIPIPEKFRPVHPGMLAVPFPPEAPMPRPASPKPKT